MGAFWEDFGTFFYRCLGYFGGAFGHRKPKGTPKEHRRKNKEITKGNPKEYQRKHTGKPKDTQGEPKEDQRKTREESPTKSQGQLKAHLQKPRCFSLGRGRARSATGSTVFVPLLLLLPLKSPRKSPGNSKEIYRNGTKGTP